MHIRKYENNFVNLMVRLISMGGLRNLKHIIRELNKIKFLLSLMKKKKTRFVKPISWTGGIFLSFPILLGTPHYLCFYHFVFSFTIIIIQL